MWKWASTNSLTVHMCPIPIYNYPHGIDTLSLIIVDIENYISNMVYDNQRFILILSSWLSNNSQIFMIIIIDFVSNIIDDIGIRQFAIQYTDNIHDISLRYSLIKEGILTNIIDNIAIIILPKNYNSHPSIKCGRRFLAEVR